MSADGYYTPEEISAVLGISKFGSEVYISRKASIYGGSNITIGDHVRIDDFCLISAGGELVFEGYNHLAAFCYVNSKGGINFGKFVGLSSRCSVYSASDDYTGENLTGPTVPAEFLKLDCRRVEIGKHTIIGSGTTVLPGVNIGECCAIGAHSLVNRNLPSNKIAAGSPIRVLRDRSTKLLELERELLNRGVENG